MHATPLKSTTLLLMSLLVGWSVSGTTAVAAPINSENPTATPNVHLMDSPDQELKKFHTIYQDALTGKPAIRLRQANAAIFLFLNNNSMLRLLDGIYTVPEKEGGLHFQIGVSNSALIAKNQRLAYTSVITTALGYGPVVAHAAFNFSALHQNTTSLNNVGPDSLSHMESYGGNVGTKIYLAPGNFSVGADVGFGVFQNRLTSINLPDFPAGHLFFQPHYNTEALSVSLFTAKQFFFPAFKNLSDKIELMPFVGYRYSHLRTKQFVFSQQMVERDFTLSSPDQSYKSNSLIFGATVKYFNAFGVDGLQFSFRFVGNLASGSKDKITMYYTGPSLKGLGTTTQKVTTDNTANKPFTLQSLITGGYQLGPIQLGLAAQVQFNNSIQGSLSGYANVSY